MKTTILATLAIILATTSWTACVGTTKKEITGAYRLTSVNQIDLPATVQHGPTEIKVVSGLMTFTDDGTCQSQTVFIPPSGESIDRNVSANYTIRGGKILMDWHGAGQTRGQITDQRFTMVNEGMHFEYERASTTPVNE